MLILYYKVVNKICQKEKGGDRDNPVMAGEVDRRAILK